MEMKCIFNIGEKNISLSDKTTPVSDVAHGPLVNKFAYIKKGNKCNNKHTIN
jgi:hypothetical protein